MSKYPHVEWLDLYGDGTMHECAVVKRDAINNVYFIRLRELDAVDKRRIFRVVTGRNANNFALWDLLFQTTLGNGMNALEYFHQYVRVKTPRGQIITPAVGMQGASVGVIPSPQAQANQLQSAPDANPAPKRSAAGRTPPPA